MTNQYEYANMLKLEILIGCYAELDQRWKRRGVCDPFTRLYFIHTGCGYLIRNGQTIPLEPGYAYMVPSGCEFDYGCERMNKLFFHITLTAAEGLDLLSAVEEICRTPFSEEDLQTLMRCCGSDDYGDLMELKMLLYRTVTECKRTRPMPPMPVQRYSQVVEQTIRFIRGNVGMELSAASIAEQIHVSESRLRKAFRAETGMPLGKYMDDLVFLRAKQMLMDSSIPISQISQSLSFCDQFYFSRRFKEKFRQTPSQYRRDVLSFRG